MKKVNIKKSPANKADKSDMRGIILDFPKQFQVGIERAKKANIRKMQLRTPIVICGMGGSISVGDLLKLWLRHEYLGFSELEVILHRGYDLPKLERREYGDGTLWEPLIIAISFSGNTEETLSAYEAAKAKSLPVVAISSGGELKRRALADGAMFVELPGSVAPRSSFGYQFGALVGVLEQFNIFSNEPDFVQIIAKTLDPKKAEGMGKTIAKSMLGALPLIYASDAWRELAHIIKIKFNEHAKHPAFWNYFPELNHNEMVGFAEQSAGSKNRSAKFHLLLLEDTADHPRTKKRMKLTAKMLEKKGIRSTIIPVNGKTVLEKIFSTLLLGDWIAYYTAILRNVDPTPVKMVEEFKKLMK